MESIESGQNFSSVIQNTGTFNQTMETRIYDDGLWNPCIIESQIQELKNWHLTVQQIPCHGQVSCMNKYSVLPSFA